MDFFDKRIYPNFQIPFDKLKVLGLEKTNLFFFSKADVRDQVFCAFSAAPVEDRKKGQATFSFFCERDTSLFIPSPSVF